MTYLCSRQLWGENVFCACGFHASYHSITSPAYYVVHHQHYHLIHSMAYCPTPRATTSMRRKKIRFWYQ
jgi:hypothetical protein